MSTSESWGVNRHTARYTSPVSVVSQCRLVSGWGLRKRRWVTREGLYFFKVMTFGGLLPPCIYYWRFGSDEESLILVECAASNDCGLLRQSAVVSLGSSAFRTWIVCGLAKLVDTYDNFGSDAPVYYSGTYRRMIVQATSTTNTHRDLTRVTFDCFSTDRWMDEQIIYLW